MAAMRLPAGQAVSRAIGFRLPGWMVFMFVTFALFFLSAGAIYAACEYFVNGVEWLGRRLNLGATAIGSVLAAFGTALPECAVTLMAVAFGSTPEQKSLGVGAAMGGPLVLATLAYAVVGLALLLNRKRLGRTSGQTQADHAGLSRDQAVFFAVFTLKVGLGLFAFAIKPWLGLAFLAAYVVYVWREIRDAETAAGEEDLEPLKIRPSAGETSLAWPCIQTLLALSVIGLASHAFVGQLEAIGLAMGWSPHLTALLLSPVATELPEIMNALIWVRQGKERLALANISGAMMIQATIPSALGLMFTPWLFDGPLLAAGAITALAVAFLWLNFRRGAVDGRALVMVGGLYGVFAWTVIGCF
ncbi:membrane protein [Pseudogulbenkiania ferrooxidans EGD-HP2]|uniref:Membrane protein n=2 Tax=Pseudogulbenkiania ferrooxidans TaxID=549169 RepID=A0ABP2XFS8_9NEIS|nr:membrane protein [Pseudogulbenkiania ferrooxidans EGD-HP2]